ncbi:MAG: PKD domain-containing protein, partial [Cyclobacteriaceae bacterium]|nr:PKD domain-containing protein [Cyclobacteriaceae bacterium]
VNFQVDAYTRSLLPTMYTWTVRSKDGEVVMSKNINAESSHFMYVFPADGKGINTYTVNLKAELADICTSDSTLSLNVNPMPVSDFTIDTLEIDCNMMLLEVNAVQKGLLEYTWTIHKDGMIINDNTSGDKFSYKVSRPGSESPGSDLSFDLQTSNYAFCESDTTSMSILVPAKPNLLASFLANRETQIFPNSTVTVNNTSTRSDAIHSWDFGDGTTSSDEIPESHNYENPGNYTIKLHLEEDYCVSIDSVNIYIQPTAPVADFSFDTAKGCAPLTVNFTNLSKYGNPEAYRWYFGEGEGISNSENPTHVYYEPGIYSVKLEATNETGVTDAAVKPSIIEVFVVPHADFTVRPETVKLPDDPIHLTNLSFEADSYYWEFGDGGNSIDFEPTHTYLDTGKYDIMLIAKTEKGCMDTVVYENIVEVIDGNEIQIPNAFTPNLDGPTGGSRYGNG